MNEISRERLDELVSRVGPGAGPDDAACRGRILIVDDEKMNRTLMSHQLGQHGFLVETAASGEEGLQRIGEQEFDLLLLDIVMPGMDGFEVLSRIRETWGPGALPVIMATGSDSSEHIARSLEGQANDYVTKPLHLPVALARIATQMERKFANDSIRRTEGRLALAIAGSNDGIWDWDLATDRVYLSERWRRIVGLRGGDDEVASDDWLDRIHAEDRQNVLKDLHAVLDGITLKFVSEHRIRHENGTYRWVLVRGMTARNGAGEARRIAGSMTDITLRRSIDRLTGLPNRAPMTERIDRTLARLRNEPGRLCALFVINIDGVGLINEGYGEQFGDMVLRTVADRLINTLRPTDVVASFGGDEFAVFLDRIDDPSNALRVGRRIQEVVGETIRGEDRTITLTAGIGVSVSASRHQSGSDLVSEALIALNRAKQAGKSAIVLFDENMQTMAARRLDIEQDLRAALDADEIRLAYQPIVDLRDGTLHGFEALARWHHPRRGPVSPADFIPVAEESGLIVPMTARLLEMAIETSGRWSEIYAAGRPFYVSVNLSARNFETTDLVANIEAVLRKRGVPNAALKVEITESQMMKDFRAARRMLDEFREAGIRIALDDFGTGHSSLAYLAELPFDTLKIDRSFVDRADLLPNKRKILQAVIALGKSLGMNIVAEGVETPGEDGLIRHLGCDAGQGYLYAKPSPADALTAILERWRIDPVEIVAPSPSKGR
ncbi:MAG: EAL domain-containing protein [Rhodospirillaceae bacterium]